MKVEDLYCGIQDGLDLGGEIISIDVVKSNDKPVSLNIKATCPNYPEVSCGYHQISLSDMPECKQSVCSENLNEDLRNLASYEYHKDVQPKKD
jgi:hypothetical protein